MRVIRHQIAITDYQLLTLPNDGQRLHVAPSRVPAHADTALDLWTIDHEYDFPYHLGIYVIGTGNPMPEPLEKAGSGWHKFIGTAITPSGLVWHVFEGPVQ